MIIVDTNILSELMQTSPNPNVLAWFRQYDDSQFYTTSITMSEIYYGLLRLPDGRRKRHLFEQFDKIITDLFDGRLLDFKCEHSLIYGEIVSNREKMGRPIETEDAQIASIAKFHNAIVATRNVKDFEYCGVEVVNPFDYG